MSVALGRRARIGQFESFDNPRRIVDNSRMNTDSRRHRSSSGNLLPIRHVPTFMTIAFEPPDQPDVIALIADLDAYQDTLYPPESRHSLDLASLKLPNVLFAVARDSEGQAIGCGAIVLHSDFGELKRMYVSPRGRGQGVAKKLMAQLESRAKDCGCKLIKLETGPYQHEALALYASTGYERRGPFGAYANDPLSVFMQKHIAA
ncbi:GNAT family N-acetyltransferase [Paraburkholderia sp. Cpub6]|uniref:GNAT family N-acetyltransferase n=1 Tax=Paraburkholderia sp. Cpub6 TaxID=2723094 RepID=UPI0017BC291C|nr:GNAT family N-acetyltransferase [Paraburkholderia sp. Cpub6]MBB5463577.1 putative acetyltransferase [Paraburkholderia sp. Cpub6]